MAKLLRASATSGGGASQVELDLKAPIASPTFTGTVAGVSATHVGLGNVDNVADASQASVGTIASGTWEGTTVAVAQGGTGVTSKTGTGNVVLSTSPTLVTPALGTPASGVMTNVTGTASGLTAGTVTTNANLTGDVTSSGNATTIATDAVDIAMLSATGTASSTTFLRGDNTWNAAGGGKLVKYQQTFMPGSTGVETDGSTLVYWSPTFDPDGGSGNNTTIFAFLNVHFRTTSSIGDGRLIHYYTVTGSDITNIDAYTPESGYTFSAYDSSAGHTANFVSTIACKGVTLDGTGSATLTYNFQMNNENAGGSTNWLVKGGSSQETSCTFMEIQL